MDCIATVATIETAMPCPANNNGPITFREYTELPPVAALSEQWDRLLQSTTCNRAFSSSAWFLSACSADPSFSPCVITAWRGPQLDGILPLVQVSGAGRAEFPPPGDYNDIIARPDDNLVMKGMLDYASGLGKTLSLKNVRLDSNCYRTLAQARPDLVEKRFQIDHTCFYIDLHTTYDDYLASRSQKLRADLRRQERKAQQDGLVVTALSPEGFAPERLPDVFLSLNFARFQEKGSLRLPARQAFVRAAFPQLFRQGRLQPFVLTAGGQVIAIDICVTGPRGLCAWNGGFLAQAEEYSPGKLLVAEQLRQSFALGWEEYDWLRGADSYKARWATGSRATGRFDFEPGFALHCI
ncbi:MAG: GNAT family N-acetyltransferase [Blastocatellia bacterium]|nr:GNAT family N-acetyltransferase [Blastocatellia bacterium]